MILFASGITKEELKFVFGIFCLSIKEYEKSEHNLWFEVHFERIYIAQIRYGIKGGMSFSNHKCKNEDERKELKELCDWYFKDTPTLTMSFSLTEEDFRVTMERDVELSEVARAVKNQHHKKKI